METLFHVAVFQALALGVAAVVKLEQGQHQKAATYFFFAMAFGFITFVFFLLLQGCITGGC
jgi:hypothetical protein